jgi:hypothetical protein
LIVPARRRVTERSAPLFQIPYICTRTHLRGGSTTTSLCHVRSVRRITRRLGELPGRGG